MKFIITLMLFTLVGCTNSPRIEISEGVIIMDQTTSDRVLEYIKLLPRNNSSSDVTPQHQPSMIWPKKQNFI